MGGGHDVACFLDGRHRVVIPLQQALYEAFPGVPQRNQVKREALCECNPVLPCNRGNKSGVWWCVYLGVMMHHTCVHNPQHLGDAWSLAAW